MLFHGAGQRLGVLADGVVDCHGRAQNGLIKQAETLGEGFVEGFGAFDELGVEGFGAVGEGCVEGECVFLENGLEGLGALREGLVNAGRVGVDGFFQFVDFLVDAFAELADVVADGGMEAVDVAFDGFALIFEHALELAGAGGKRGAERFGVAAEHRFHRVGALAKRLAERVGVIHQDGLEVIRAPLQRGAEGLGVVGQHRLQVSGAIAERGFEAAGLMGERTFQLAEVLAGARDDRGELELLIAELLDQLGNLDAKLFKRGVEMIAGVDEGVTLVGEFVDEAADAALVFFVGEFERADLCVDKRFEFAGPAKGAGDGIIHKGDLAAHGLAERGDGLFRHAVRFGETDGDLGHGGRAHVQLFRAPCQKGQKPEQGNGASQRCDEGREPRAGEDACQTIRETEAAGCEGDGKSGCQNQPEAGAGSGVGEGAIGGALVERKDQAADGGQIIVGCDLFTGRGGRTAARCTACLGLCLGHSFGGGWFRCWGGIDLRRLARGVESKGRVASAHRILGCRSGRSGGHGKLGRSRGGCAP